MAKLPKWPKQPKSNASISTWENYERKVKEVAARRKEIQAPLKKKQTIKDRARSLKNKS